MFCDVLQCDNEKHAIINEDIQSSLRVKPYVDHFQPWRKAVPCPART
jgi:hypothetical protein